jgi:hypothetical protein
MARRGETRRRGLTFRTQAGGSIVPQITTRDAVNRALAAMEIADSCSHPRIRHSFTALAESWLQQASESEHGPADEASEQPTL